MENNNDFQEEYKKLDHEAAKYNRREFDLVYDIISEMVKGRDDVGDNGNFDIPLVKGEIIDEAIKRAGFSKDETFIADFKHYRDIEQKARNLQLQSLEQTIKNMGDSSLGDTMQKAGFVKSMELQEIMDNVLSKVREENPYFPHPTPFGDVKKQDDKLDLLLGSQGYEITGGWLIPYFDELNRYRVDELLDKIGFPLEYLLTLIKEIGENIRNDSDRPIKLRNNILEILNRFNEYPGSGQVIQLLFLLGIIKWFEGCDINEGDKGYIEAKNLHDNIVSRFIEIYVMYTLYFDKDEHSKPLDEFLANDETVTPIRIAMRKRNMSKGRDEAEELANDQSENKNSSLVGSQTGNIKNDKTFTDHIISEKENRKILNVLHQLIDGRKGKDIAFVILALIETGMIVNPKPRNKLYKSMRDEFGNIGSDASINDVLNPSNEHKREKNTIESIVSKLREIK